MSKIDINVHTNGSLMTALGAASSGNQVNMAMALPAVFNILESWGCKQKAQQTLLGLNSLSTLKKYRKDPESASLGRDTLERMSYILNIYKSLRILFSHEDSVNNWVNKPNKHPFFRGKSAMEVMLNGNVADLYNVSSRLAAFRGGHS